MRASTDGSSKRTPVALALASALIAVLTLSGCGHLAHPHAHGVYYAPYHPHVAPTPRYPWNWIYHQPIHLQDQRIYQHIQNHMNLPGPSYRDVTWRDTRFFFVDDNPLARLTGEDGTIREVSIVERHRVRIRECRSALQWVSAVHYQSLQYANCD